MDHDDYRVEGELADMREDKLERRIAELEAQNAEYRKKLGIPPEEKPVEHPPSPAGKVHFDWANGVIKIEA